MDDHGTAREATDGNTVQHRKYAICIPGIQGKNTDTHSEYLILITFPPQRWLRERASMLRYSTLPVLLEIVSVIHEVYVV